jgi:two-component sensor histidine kinase
MVEMARTNLLPRNSRVRFETDVEDITVASQQATSLALILNELISNALHHGLRDGAEGVVSVRGVRGAGRVTIVVTDNGQGLPADFTMATHSHLGLQIVQTLARSDLRGDMVVERLEPGTRVTVVFPLALP